MKQNDKIELIRGEFLALLDKVFANPDNIGPILRRIEDGKPIPLNFVVYPDYLKRKFAEGDAKEAV